MTLYAKHGDWFAISMLSLCVLIVILRKVSHRES